jgi:hypothetical protein
VLGAALLGLDHIGGSNATADAAAEWRLRAALRGWDPANG